MSSTMSRMMIRSGPARLKREASVFISEWSVSTV
jgi:hypothetical protein